MPPGWTTRQTVADYARAIERDLGPSYVMGLSTGGLIAQHLVLYRPELVRRLALVVTAARLSEERRRICERWRELAHQEEWLELKIAMLCVVTTGAARRLLAGAYVGLFGRFLPRKSYDPSDFLTTRRPTWSTTRRGGSPASPRRPS